MLCTVIWDIYRSDERPQVWEALQSLLLEDSPDWSRKGVYGYWDPETKKLLYLGLANNLPERFSQHNGLVPHSGGNKSDQIEAWFERHEQLGLTTMIQAAAVGLLDLMHEISPSLGAESSEIIALGEGQLIELHRRETGARPSWNRIGGSKYGAELAIENGHSLIPILSAARDSLFVARRSLRDLTADERARTWEATIHSARMRAVLDAHDIRGLPAETPDISKRIEQLLLVRAGHLVDDLSPSNADIMEWLRRIEDGRANAEVHQLREGLSSLTEEIPVSSDRQVAAMLSAIVDSADFSADAKHVTDLLAARYLMANPLEAF
jgi:hypothetical protein